MRSLPFVPAENDSISYISLSFPRYSCIALVLQS